MTNAQAWAIYDGMVSDRRAGFADEPVAIELHWKRYAARDMASPKVWMDAYLAAFAVAGTLRLVTTDQGFTQYVGLDLVLLSQD